MRTSTLSKQRQCRRLILLHRLAVGEHAVDDYFFLRNTDILTSLCKWIIFIYCSYFLLTYVVIVSIRHQTDSNLDVKVQNHLVRVHHPTHPPIELWFRSR